jgi:hypothetical protein
MKAKKIKIAVKVTIYLIISVLAQHFYHYIFEGSGGGIAVVVFTVCDILDDDISIFHLLRGKEDRD